MVNGQEVGGLRVNAPGFMLVLTHGDGQLPVHGNLIRSGPNSTIHVCPRRLVFFFFLEGKVRGTTYTLTYEKYRPQFSLRARGVIVNPVFFFFAWATIWLHGRTATKTRPEPDPRISRDRPRATNYSKP